MAEPRKDRQTPSRSIDLPYSDTRGPETVAIYNSTGRSAQEWQQLLCYDILSVKQDGLWVRIKFGHAVPRRNGKNEIAAIREMRGLKHDENILHTTHRTTTSHVAMEEQKSRNAVPCCSECYCGLLVAVT
ncbi:MAG: hypothetical protein RRZ24_10095 [Clostridia bacterium]